MSSFADRNRTRFIEQFQGDGRIGGGKVVAAAALMRLSIVMLVLAGLVGALGFQFTFGEGGLQFGLGLTFGYLLYIGLLLFTMGKPRVLGTVAVLTDRKLVLLGSRRAGVLGDWNHAQVESVELLRKGNPLVMAKIAITPVGEDRMVFFCSNRSMGGHFVEQFQRRRG